MKKEKQSFLESFLSFGLLPLGLHMLLFACLRESGAFSSLAQLWRRLR